MPIGMDRPPMPPPPVQAQMGIPAQGQEAPPPPPPGGMGTIAQAGGAPNPHGAVLSQVEAVKRVLEQMAQTEPVMAPFAQQAMQALDNGLAAVNSAPRSSPEGLSPASQGPTPPTGGSTPAGGMSMLG